MVNKIAVTLRTDRLRSLILSLDSAGSSPDSQYWHPQHSCDSPILVRCSHSFTIQAPTTITGLSVRNQWRFIRHCCYLVIVRALLLPEGLPQATGSLTAAAFVGFVCLLPLVAVWRAPYPYPWFPALSAWNSNSRPSLASSWRTQNLSKPARLERLLRLEQLERL